MITTSGMVLLDTTILVHVLRDDGMGRKVGADHSLQARPDKPLISIVTVGEALAFARKRSWGEKAAIDAFCEARGRKLSKNDLWIAATSAVAKAHLLTADKDFDLLDGVFLQRTYYDPGGVYV